MADKTIEEIFTELQHGVKSVRALAKENGIPFATLRDRLRKYAGKEYMKYKAGGGTINAILLEIIGDTKTYSEAEIATIKSWYHKNYDKILKESFNREIPIYTDKKMMQLERTTVPLNENVINGVLLDD